jgi:homoserine O-acetyltransferase
VRTLQCGITLPEVAVAYQTYGTLNAKASNAILVCHALTGDQYLTGIHPLTGKEGWWHTMIGPGKTIDTNRFFVIGTNVLGGCAGSTGPLSINPATGKAYGIDFPTVTMRDMVQMQYDLIQHLGIQQLAAIIGPSMGGMQAMQWGSMYPQAARHIILLATSHRHSAQNIAFHEIGRQAIMADPDWHGGRYHDFGVTPRRGLSVARMTGHVTYMSQQTLQRRFGRTLQERSHLSYGFDADFQVESYLRYQGSTFVDRFDANSYLYMTRATDYFDLAYDHGGVLAKAFSGHTRYHVISLSSDWLFPTADMRQIVKALNASGHAVSFVEIQTDRGHDAFLLNEPDVIRTLASCVEGL